MFNKIIRPIVISVLLVICLSPFMMDKYVKSNQDRQMKAYDIVMMNHKDYDKPINDKEYKKAYDSLSNKNKLWKPINDLADKYFGFLMSLGDEQNRNLSQEMVAGNMIDSSDAPASSNTLDLSLELMPPIGTLIIPSIDLTIPIFDNSSDYALNNGTGVLEGTPLPTGTVGENSVITGHNGLSVGALFTNLPKMKKGDKFFIKKGEEILAYQVDKLSTIKPENIDLYKNVEGHDYVSLVTCTPIFRNTERLVVRGERIQYNNESLNTSYKISTVGWVFIALSSLLLFELVGMPLWRRFKSRGGDSDEKEA